MQFVPRAIQIEFMRKSQTIADLEQEASVYLRSNDRSKRRYAVVLNALVADTNRVVVQLRLARERYA